MKLRHQRFLLSALLLALCFALSSCSAAGFVPKSDTTWGELFRQFDSEEFSELDPRLQQMMDEAVLSQEVTENEAQPLTEAAVGSMLAKENPGRSVYSDQQAAKLAPQKLYLRITSMKSDEWPHIKAVLLSQPGDTPVYLYPTDTKKKTLAARRYWCQPDVPFLEKLRFLLGEEDVIIK